MRGPPTPGAAPPRVSHRRLKFHETTGVNPKIRASALERNSVVSASLILMVLMKRKTDQRRNVRAPFFRRLLTIVVAAAYLMVGFAGEVSCAEETLPAAASLDASAGLATTDEG